MCSTHSSPTDAIKNLNDALMKTDIVFFEPKFKEKIENQEIWFGDLSFAFGKGSPKSISEFLLKRLSAIRTTTTAEFLRKFALMDVTNSKRAGQMFDMKNYGIPKSQSLKMKIAQKRDVNVPTAVFKERKVEEPVKIEKKPNKISLMSSLRRKEYDTFDKKVPDWLKNNDFDDVDENENFNDFDSVISSIPPSSCDGMESQVMSLKFHDPPRPTEKAKSCFLFE